MAFPDGLKFRFLYGAGVEFLAPDMGVQFIYGGDRRDLDGTGVKVGDVAGVAVWESRTYNGELKGTGEIG